MRITRKGLTVGSKLFTHVSCHFAMPHLLRNHFFPILNKQFVFHAVAAPDRFSDREMNQ
jgi:hypothetical protein